MAGPKMWPATLPPQVRSDIYRKAEVRIYDLLREQLDSSWTVFYSRPWLGLTPTGGEKDGECDFVIVHPRYGFLAMEVKGGGIGYDPATDAWVSTDRNGIRHSIKNPVEQARRAKHELLERARQQRMWPAAHFVRARHGVIFPDAVSPPGNLGADRPRDLFCCRPDLPHLRTWVLSRLDGGDEDDMGAAGVQAFERLLAAPFMLRVPLSHVLADDEQEIQSLTPQQFHILDSIAHLHRVAVGGGAGTGKTILAMEDALRLAESGARTLLTCLSPDLAAELQGRLRGKPVEVLSFPALCASLGESAGLADASAPFSSDRSPELLVDAVALNAGLAFDAIVVDEGQDFRSHWWIALESLLKDSAVSVLHAFYDTNQRVYGELSGQLASFQLIPIRLTRNLRNTQMIHNEATRFYSGLPITADGPLGVNVQWLECTEVDVGARVSEIVRTLCNSEAVAPHDIAVLAPEQEVLNEVGLRLRKQSVDGVMLSPIRNFKGLERKVVVVAATKELADVIELAYVALSRARVHLSVVGESAILGWLRGDT